MSKRIWLAMYLPGEDAWVDLPPAPITGRGDANVAWTGQEVLIVGGAERAGRPGQVTGVQRDGAAYDPATNRWRVIPEIPDGVWPLRDRGVGAIRERFAGTWDGEALFLWGRDIARYDPTADAWDRVRAPLTTFRFGGGTTAVRAGDRVVVIGLVNREDPDPDTFGFTYQPASGEIGSAPGLPTGGMDQPRQVVAAGQQVVVMLPDSGAAAMWRPGEPSWRSTPPALARGSQAVAVWTGETLLVWGGSPGAEPRADGIAWTP